jgi:hypothetical protein
MSGMTTPSKRASTAKPKPATRHAVSSTVATGPFLRFHHHGVVLWVLFLFAGGTQYAINGRVVIDESALATAGASI